MHSMIDAAALGRLPCVYATLDDGRLSALLPPLCGAAEGGINIAAVCGISIAAVIGVPVT